MRTAILLMTLGVSPALLYAESAGGLRWTMPAGWKVDAAHPMRVATYTIPPAPGDPVSAECGIFFFGTGQGGGVQDNIDRWRSQIQGSDGRPAPAKIDNESARGLNITVIDSSGTYTGMGGPMAGGSRVVPGYRLLGAVVQHGGNNIFVKFTGPAKTIAANQQKFDQLLASFQSDK